MSNEIQFFAAGILGLASCIYLSVFFKQRQLHLVLARIVFWLFAFVAIQMSAIWLTSWSISASTNASFYLPGLIKLGLFGLPLTFQFVMCNAICKIGALHELKLSIDLLVVLQVFLAAFGVLETLLKPVFNTDYVNEMVLVFLMLSLVIVHLFAMEEGRAEAI